MTDTNPKDEESGACRSCTAQLEVHHRPTIERHNNDTLRRVCCCMPFAMVLKVVVSNCEPLTSKYFSKIAAEWSGQMQGEG